MLLEVLLHHRRCGASEYQRITGYWEVGHQLPAWSKSKLKRKGAQGFKVSYHVFILR